MKPTIAVFLTTLLLGGCTLNYDANLALSEPGLRVKRAGSELVGIKVSVGDARVDKTNIGTAWNAASKLKYVMVPAQSPQSVVAKGIEAEFQARGYRFGDGPPFLLVDVERADSLMNGGGWDVRASCTLAAKVLDADGRTLYAHTFKREEQGATDDPWSMHNAGAVKLAKMIGQAIREMGEDEGLLAALFAAAGR